MTNGGRAVAGATVFLVPAADVAKLKKAPSFNIRRNVDDDEPMDDSIAANGDKYPQAVTDGKGGVQHRQRGRPASTSCTWCPTTTGTCPAARSPTSR